MSETIKPGVVIDGETYYPPGWMYILAFALRGCQWAVDKASDPEFRVMIKSHLKEEESEIIRFQIQRLEKRLDELNSDLGENDGDVRLR